ATLHITDHLDVALVPRGRIGQVGDPTVPMNLLRVEVDDGPVLPHNGATHASAPHSADLAEVVDHLGALQVAAWVGQFGDVVTAQQAAILRLLKLGSETAAPLAGKFAPECSKAECWSRLVQGSQVGF